MRESRVANQSADPTPRCFVGEGPLAAGWFNRLLSMTVWGAVAGDSMVGSGCVSRMVAAPARPPGCHGRRRPRNDRDRRGGNRCDGIASLGGLDARISPGYSPVPARWKAR